MKRQCDFILLILYWYVFVFLTIYKMKTIGHIYNKSKIVLFIQHLNGFETKSTVSFFTLVNPYTLIQLHWMNIYIIEHKDEIINERMKTYHAKYIMPPPTTTTPITYNPPYNHAYNHAYNPTHTPIMNEQLTETDFMKIMTKILYDNLNNSMYFLLDVFLQEIRHPMSFHFSHGIYKRFRDIYVNLKNEYDNIMLQSKQQYNALKNEINDLTYELWYMYPFFAFYYSFLCYNLSKTYLYINNTRFINRIKCSG